MIPAHKTTIMVHCLATKPSWGDGKSAEDMVKEVRGWHVNDNGWADIAYAGIIDHKGAWAAGRDLDGDGDVWEETGAGARGWNKNTIHLALAGGFGGDANDSPYTHYTPAQMAKLRQKIDEIQALAGRKLQVKGHNEVANKACPCFKVTAWYNAEPPRSAIGSKTLQGGATAAIGGVGSSIAAIGALDGHAQILAVLCLAAVAVGAFIVFRSRLTDWANGRR